MTTSSFKRFGHAEPSAVEGDAAVVQTPGRSGAAMTDSDEYLGWPVELGPNRRLGESNHGAEDAQPVEPPRTPAIAAREGVVLIVIVLVLLMVPALIFWSSV